MNKSLRFILEFLLTTLAFYWASWMVQIIASLLVSFGLEWYHQQRARRTLRQLAENIARRKTSHS